MFGSTQVSKGDEGQSSHCIDSKISNEEREANVNIVTKLCVGTSGDNVAEKVKTKESEARQQVATKKLNNHGHE